MKSFADSFLAFMAFGVVISQLVVIAIYFIRLKYLKQAKINYWGISILLNVVFMLMAFATAKLLATTTNNNVNLFANILLISDLGFGLLVYQQHKKISKEVIWGIFIIFIILWCGEFALNIKQNGYQNIDRLRITGVFMHLVFVTGAWIYFIDLIKKPFIEFRRMPFFWIIIGWLFYYILTSTTLFTGLTGKSKLPVLLMYDWTFFAETVANVLYAIAFWKSKKWVERNNR
jgi:hypothetical protein